MPKRRALSRSVKTGLFLGTVCLLGYAGERACKILMEPTTWGSMMGAIERGDAKGVRYWLDWGVDPNMAFGTSPLAEAKIRGNAEIVKMLLQAGANQSVPVVPTPAIAPPAFHPLADKESVSGYAHDMALQKRTLSARIDAAIAKSYIPAWSCTFLVDACEKEGLAFFSNLGQ